jgi:uncharacterized peroxidase-related enzyme
MEVAEVSDGAVERIAMLAEDSRLATFRRARTRYGWLPNTIRVMARSASAAALYLDAGGRNAAASLSALERELVAVTTAAHNGCEYCLAAHSVGLVVQGASRDDALAARRGVPGQARSAAIVAFARAVLEERGMVAGEQLAAARDAGLDDGALLDIVAVVAENILGNYVNNVAATPTDELVRRAAERLHLAPFEGVAA